LTARERHRHALERGAKAGFDVVTERVGHRERAVVRAEQDDATFGESPARRLHIVDARRPRRFCRQLLLRRARYRRRPHWWIRHAASEVLSALV
jgi:hypothetical protein